MTDSTQELDEILNTFSDASAARGWLDCSSGSKGTHPRNDLVSNAKQAIIDWHNKQVEEAMAKFHLKKDVKYDVKASDSVIVITHTNNLQDSSND